MHNSQLHSHTSPHSLPTLHTSALLPARARSRAVLRLTPEPPEVPGRAGAGAGAGALTQRERCVSRPERGPFSSRDGGLPGAMD